MPTPRIICFMLVLLLSAPAFAEHLIRPEGNQLTHQHAKLRAQQVLRVDYQLSLILNKTKGTFTGEVLIDFDMAKGNKQPLTVDFDSGTVKQIKINDRIVNNHYRRWFIVLAAHHFKPGRNTIQIEYERQYDTNGTGFHQSTALDDPDEVYVFTDFESYRANHLFPLFDQPDLKAHFTLDVIAPPDWQLISSTRESHINKLDASNHWYFKRSPLMPSYVFSLHGGPFHVFKDENGKVPLRLFVRNDIKDEVDSDNWFRVTKQSMNFFEQYFDIPYPFVKYDQVIIPDYDVGAMENLAAVTFGEDYYVPEGGLSKARRDELYDTIAHEMSHMWFGNLVTMQWWNGLWLNESVTSYMAVLAMEKALKMDDAWDTFHANFKKWGYESDQLITTHAIELPVANTTQADTLFDGITYGKGAAVIAQLSRFVGEDNFRKGLRNYLKKYTNQNTVLSDLMSELAKVSGKDLKRWTQDWLYSPGLNTVRSEIRCNNNRVTKAVVYQSADKNHPTLRQHQLQLGFYRVVDGKIQREKVYLLLLDGKQTEIKQAIGANCPQFSFANEDDWGFVKVDLSGQSLAFLEANLKAMPTTKMRLMLWQSLWYMVNDLTLPIDKFVALAEKHLKREKDHSVIRLVNDYLIAATEHLAKLAHRLPEAAPILMSIEKLAWQQFNNTPVHWERQLMAFELFTEVAHSEFGLAKVEQLLKAEENLLAFNLHEDRRWELLYLLNQYRFGDYQALTDEQYFKSDKVLGKGHLLIARHIVPEAKAKQKWLDLFAKQVKKQEYESAQWVMSFAFPSSQAPIYQQFQQQILDRLAELDSTAPPHYLVTYSEQLIDGSCTKQSIKRLAEANDKYRNLPPLVVQHLQVTHQLDQRCFDIGQRLNEQN